MNTISLTGRLTKAIRSNAVDGTPVVNFTAAVEMGSKPALATVNGKEQLVMIPATSYIDAAAWGNDAIAAATLEAGQEVSFQLNSLGSKARSYNGKILSDVIARVSNVVPGAKAKVKSDAPAAAASTVDSIPF